MVRKKIEKFIKRNYWIETWSKNKIKQKLMKDNNRNNFS